MRTFDRPALREDRETVAVRHAPRYAGGSRVGVLQKGALMNPNCPRRAARRVVVSSLAASCGLACSALAHDPTILGPGGAPVITGAEQAGDDHAGCMKAQMARTRFLAGEIVNDRGDMDVGIAELLDDTDCLHNNLDIAVVPTTRNISGSNTMTLKSKVAALTQFTFVLRSNYAISSVVVDGVTTIPGASVTSLGTYGRRITLPRTYTLDEQFTVKVNYSGTAQSVGLGSISFGNINGQQFVGSLSEPYYAASWWPCKDSDWGLPGNNADKATLDIAITAPDNLVSVSNGVLQGVDVLTGSRKRYRWHSDYPMPTYLVCFGSHPYNQYDYVYTYPGGTMPFTIYISPGSDTANNRGIWARSLDMMAAYRGVLGEYPFVNEKYGIYHFTFGGGMEHQTITGMGGGFSESITAHELGHQWLGDNITCRTWSDIWLNEGGATFCEALWEERKPGSSGAPAYRAAMNARRPSAVSDSVYVYDTTDVNRIFSGTYSYDKGAWVYHMLRGVAGEGNFLNIMSAYRAQYQGSAATTDDFSDICTGVLGTDMQYFFDQWVYAPGAAAYAYGFQTANINGQDYLRLSLRQTQSTGYGVNGVYKMPIDLRVDRTGGSTSYKIFNDARTEHFVIPITAPATGVALDEFTWILTTSKTAETYVAGPAKIVQADPAPGETTPSGSPPGDITVTFSENVAPLASNFTVVGPGGSVPFSLSYAAPNFTATLDTGELPPGLYTVTVSQDVRTTPANIQLDGEITGTTLPSGDGLAGGNAVYTFTVLGCRADFNHDGQSDFFDYLDFVQAFDSGDPSGDFNGDTQVDFFDYLDFVQAFDTGCA
jgi:hypothetical protein